jgi:nucleotidyltransferase substrate binding protein (TIGR01987 family)
MLEKDIRWKQRFENYQKILAQLTEIVNTAGERELSDIEQYSIIKVFELTFELAWQVMKDFLTYKAVAKNIIGSRDAIRCALQEGLITNGHIWIDMIDDRNRAAHAYDEVKVRTLADKIADVCYAEFVDFQKKMDSLK